MPRCCTQYNYASLAGNTGQSYTKTCTQYWAEEQTVTETIPANTIYAICESKANDYAEQIVRYRATQSTHCNDEFCNDGEPSCWVSICVALGNPTDIQYLEYWATDLGVMFSQDVSICVSIVNNCGPALAARITFRPGLIFTQGSIVGTVSAITDPEFGSTCTTLKGGVLYTFGINIENQPSGQNWNFVRPGRYVLGRECDAACPPQAVPQNSAITQFPAVIDYCQQTPEEEEDE